MFHIRRLVDNHTFDPYILVHPKGAMNAPKRAREVVGDGESASEDGFRAAIDEVLESRNSWNT